MSRRTPEQVRVTFSGREIRDLVIAWVALSAAFAVFFLGGGAGVAALASAGAVGELALVFAIAGLTAGIGFLLHELGHKVTAVRFGRLAAFRADYGMLALGVFAAAGGFIFAAPGAVEHVGRSDERELGLVALAGPVVNVGLAVVFLPVWFAGGLLGIPPLARLGQLGVVVNLALAAFNLVPFGPLDGKTVRAWNTGVWLVSFLPTAAAAAFLLFTVGLF